MEKATCHVTAFKWSIQSGPGDHGHRLQCPTHSGHGVAASESRGLPALGPSPLRGSHGLKRLKRERA